MYTEHMNTQTVIKLPKWTIEGREEQVAKLWTKISDTTWKSIGDENLLLEITE